MLRSILLSEKSYGWYASLQWDNNWCNPDFATCCKLKDDALALMLEKAKKDRRTRGYDLNVLPIVECGLTQRAPDRGVGVAISSNDVDVTPCG